MSLDGRFGCAYDAARALATVVVRAKGYRIKAAGGAHYNTFQALRAAWGESSDGLVAYLDDCRSKRNIVSYDAVGMVTETEVDALIERTTTLLQEVEAWLAAHHPELI